MKRHDLPAGYAKISIVNAKYHTLKHAYGACANAGSFITNKETTNYNSSFKFCYVYVQYMPSSPFIVYSREYFSI